MTRYDIGAITAALCLAAGTAGAQPLHATFALHVNPAMLACLEKVQGVPPTASVTVTTQKLHDKLVLTVDGLKPNLAFDMFTVQRSNLDSNGNPVQGFTNFGLAWYQSDVKANSAGHASTSIGTILVDQIFGFDPDAALAPTNTFHVGFWFNNPNDAQPCGFDPSKPTPFNGEHDAGPVAMISIPDANTGLGPLCRDPNNGTNPPTCNP
jgi:hypothetical protein